MTQYSVTLREDHVAELKEILIRSDNAERAAYVFFGSANTGLDPWDREAHEKYLSVHVRAIPDNEFVSADEHHVTWLTNSFVKALKDAEANDYTLAIVHSHPNGQDVFSDQDDQNEQDLVQLGVNRNGNGTKLISLVFAGKDRIFGRVWLQPTENGHSSLRSIKVWGARLKFHFAGTHASQASSILRRQALAFGEALNTDLKRMRIGIVGCGGTGSAVAMLLARIGIGQLALFDNDIVEETNLNRLHGATQTDADGMRAKAEVVAESIANMGLGVRARPFNAWVGDPENRDALRSCDVIFGCTDDHDGRMFLNRLAYYYLIPVIDMGLAVEVTETEPPKILTLDGRVTVLGPHHTCLVCAELVNPEIARAEVMRRSRPDEYEKQKHEAYVLGEGNPSPAVVTFTTELACMAIDELLQRMQGFRGPEGNAANRVRKFNLAEDRRPGYRSRTGCSICDKDDLWGRGDADPFMGRAG